jgi:hypothetical protein
MGKRVLLLAVALIGLVGMTAGCGSLDAVKEAKGLLEDYYDAFTDEDYEDIVNMCDASLVDDAGGAKNLAEALANRYAYYGGVDEYKITGTSFETSGGVTEIELSVDATYASGDTMSDTFIMLKQNGNLSITGIDLE